MITVDVFDHLADVAMMARSCPTPVLRRAYVTAMRDWCMVTRWLRLTILGASQAGKQTYDLGSDTFVEVVGIVAMSVTDKKGNILPVTTGDAGGWDPNNGQHLPRKYSYVPEGQFALYPVPDDSYSLTVTAQVQPKDGVTQIPAAPLVKYSTTFEAGALAYLLAMKDMPWSNPAEAVNQGRVYRSGVANGKAEVARNFNTGSMRVRPRPFLR